MKKTKKSNVKEKRRKAKFNERQQLRQLDLQVKNYFSKNQKV
jgi:hypothetical protein